MPPAPMFFPPPPPRRNLGLKWAGLIFGTLATLIFTGSLILNIAFLFSSASDLDIDRVSEHTLVGGDVTRKVAVVPVNGIILDKSAERFGQVLKHVENETNVKALVVEIDTPGGSVSASDQMYHRLLQFKATKPGVPVVIAMKGLATSGGYYLACAGDYIYAEPTTLTANIGVLMPRYNLAELADKWGVKDSTLKSQGSPYKDAGSMLKPDNPRDTAYMQALIDEMYGQFKGVVEKARGAQVKAKKTTVDAVADGRALTAKQAQSVGLIDQIGYPADAYKYAASTAGITGEAVIRYEEKPSLSDLFTAKSGVSAPAGAFNVTLDRDLLETLATPHLLYLWTGN